MRYCLSVMHSYALKIWQGVFETSFFYLLIATI